MGADDKYLVDIFTPPKAVPSSKESLEAIKGAVKGKMLAKMKKEAVDCPVKLKVVSFVECFTCPNFNRRVRRESWLQRPSPPSQVIVALFCGTFGRSVRSCAPSMPGGWCDFVEITCYFAGFVIGRTHAWRDPLGG